MGQVPALVQFHARDRGCDVLRQARGRHRGREPPAAHPVLVDGGAERRTDLSRGAPEDDEQPTGGRARDGETGLLQERHDCVVVRRGRGELVDPLLGGDPPAVVRRGGIRDGGGQGLGAREVAEGEVDLPLDGRVAGCRPRVPGARGPRRHRRRVRGAFRRAGPRRAVDEQRGEDEGQREQRAGRPSEQGSGREDGHGGTPREEPSHGDDCGWNRGRNRCDRATRWRLDAATRPPVGPGYRVPVPPGHRPPTRCDSPGSPDVLACPPPSRARRPRPPAPPRGGGRRLRGGPGSPADGPARS